MKLLDFRERFTGVLFGAAFIEIEYVVWITDLQIKVCDFVEEVLFLPAQFKAGKISQPDEAVDFRRHFVVVPVNKNCLERFLQDKMADKEAPIVFGGNKHTFGSVQIMPGTFKPVLDMLLLGHPATYLLHFACRLQRHLYYLRAYSYLVQQQGRDQWLYFLY